ncbi:MAG: inositol monophosphatase family protein [Chloroflexota bacterium]
MTGTKEETPELFLQFALDAAWQAGRLTLAHFQTGVAAERKADNTPVTIADRQAEQTLRALIEQYWPQHGIVGEEYGRSPAKNSPYTWILDPIDGTKFVSGVPLKVPRALTKNDQPIVGCGTFPGTK